MTGRLVESWAGHKPRMWVLCLAYGTGVNSKGRREASAVTLDGSTWPFLFSLVMCLSSYRWGNAMSVRAGGAGHMRKDTMED